MNATPCSLAHLPQHPSQLLATQFLDLLVDSAHFPFEPVDTVGRPAALRRSIALGGGRRPGVAPPLLAKGIDDAPGKQSRCHYSEKPREWILRDRGKKLGFPGDREHESYERSDDGLPSE